MPAERQHPHNITIRSTGTPKCRFHRRRTFYTNTTGTILHQRQRIQRFSPSCRGTSRSQQQPPGRYPHTVKLYNPSASAYRGHAARYELMIRPAPRQAAMSRRRAVHRMVCPQ
ncbi:hypothetical protein [Escherichia coli]